MRIRGYTCAAALMLSISGLSVAEEASVDQARDALAKKNDDADSAKALEEVFQAAEKSYTLLKKGERTLTYGFDYALVRDQRLTLVPLTKTSGGTQIYGLAGRQSQSQHTFTNSFTFDYGIWDNLTFSFRLPLVAKYDTEMDTHAYSLGDVSATLRWQPWAAVRGRPVTTLYTTIGLPTGDSPYKTNLDKDISTGNGYYSLGFGANMSYVIDPVVLYGSLGYTWNLPVDDVQPDPGRQLPAGEGLARQHDQLQHGHGLRAVLRRLAGDFVPDGLHAEEPLPHHCRYVRVVRTDQ